MSWSEDSPIHRDNGNTCEFFETEDWTERQWQAARRWNLAEFLVESEGEEKAREKLSVFAERVDGVTADPENVANGERVDVWSLTVGEAWERGEDAVEFEKADVIEAWQDRGDLSPSVPDSCPHEAEEDGLCIFHLPIEQKDEAEVTEAFLQKIEEGDKLDKQFVGGKFERLDLAYDLLESDDTHPINLNYAEIRGDLRMVHTSVHPPINLRCAEIEGGANLHDAEFRRHLGCGNAVFRGDLLCATTDFDHAEFEEATVAGRAEFGNATFDTNARFNGATFHDEVAFEIASFEGIVSFDDAVFRESATFKNAVFDAITGFERTRFVGDATFGNARFREQVLFSNATFEREADFMIANFERRADFDGTCATDSDIDLRKAEILDGKISIPGDEPTFYDLGFATLGDVDLSSDTDHDLFEHFNLCVTEFDGFDFTSHRDQLIDDWTIHTYPYGDRPNDLEKTYLKAKNGAKEIGDQDAASEFFIKEMRARRRGYDRALNVYEDFLPRTVLRGKRFANRLLEWSAGYGERPWRVVALSVATIVVSAGLYPLTEGIRTGPNSVVQFDWTVEAALKYLYFSVATFTTVGYGDFQPAGTVAQLLAGTESFVGALLMALLIFVFGRSLKW